MAREYRLYRVKTPYGTAPWQVDSGQKKRSLYPIVEEVTAIDSRDVEPLERALRMVRVIASEMEAQGREERVRSRFEDGYRAASCHWASDLRAALQPFTPENNSTNSACPAGRGRERSNDD